MQMTSDDAMYLYKTITIIIIIMKNIKYPTRGYQTNLM